MYKVLCILTFMILGQQMHAQTQPKPLRVGLFTPLYLDSAFDDLGKYKSKTSFPKQSISGLEFYEGAVLAIDSINRSGRHVIMEVFDLQSTSGEPSQLFRKGKFDSLDLLIAHAGGIDFVELARIAKEKNLPLVSATYPNDAGIQSSPMVFIANPTISTHMDAINQKIQEKWTDANLIWLKGENSADDILDQLFREANNKTGGKKPDRIIPLKKPMLLEEISKWIDSTRTNVIVAGSLDEEFGVDIVRLIETYPKKGILNIIGMPNWESIKEIQSRQYSVIPIFFTSGFFIPNGHEWANNFDGYFKKEISIKASISSYKGFELTYYFSNILSKYGKMVLDKPEDIRFKVLNDFDFKAVSTIPPSEIPDFYENKKVYFIRRLNNVLSVQ